MLIRYGASDVLVPPAHGDWLAAHVPNCVVKVDDAGHLGRNPVAEIAEDVCGCATGRHPPEEPRQRARESSSSPAPVF